MAVLHLGRCVAEAVALGLDVLCRIKACRAEDLLGKSQGSGSCGSDRDLHALQVGNILCTGLCVGNDLIDLVVNNADGLDVGGGCGECAGSFEAVGGNVVHGDAQVHFARLHQVDVLDRCAGGLSRDGDTVSSQLVVDGVRHGAAQCEVGSAGRAGSHDEVSACRCGSCGNTEQEDKQGMSHRGVLDGVYSVIQSDCSSRSYWLISPHHTWPLPPHTSHRRPCSSVVMAKDPLSHEKPVGHS